MPSARIAAYPGPPDARPDQRGLCCDRSGPGASLGLLVVVAQSPQSLPGPEGNHFPTEDELAALLDRTGFRLLEQTSRPDDAPLSWSRRVERVNAAIATRHRSTPAYELAARQGERLSRLFATEQVSMQLIHAVSQSGRLSCHHC